mgnify:CR=1 FL=1
MLVAASANRDMMRYERASRYWRRALVSSPNQAQRGIAIRGLVIAAMKDGAAIDVLNTARRFLRPQPVARKLEPWPCEFFSE